MGQTTIAEFGIRDLNKILDIEETPANASKPVYLLTPTEDIKSQIRKDLERIFK